jgi:3-(3-hydroxy-phenyl)propionate hydroxylase
MAEPILPVVVIGAGPTGVTAATLLGRAGIDVLVLERWTDVFAQPRAVHLDDEVYRILDRLGVAAEFATISRPSQGLRLLDPNHRTLAQFERAGTSAASGYPRANMFDQPVLEALLRRNMTGHPGVTLRGGVEVLSITQTGAGVVDVQVRDVAADTTETVRARFVLGCDGANSIVRRSIGAELSDLHFEQRWLVVDIDTDADLHQWEGVHQLCNSRRAGTYMRVGERRYRWEFALLDGETAADFEGTDSLLPLIAPWLGDVDPAALHLVRVAEYTFRAAIADRWRSGSVFLLGDAAHLTPPFVGQGMGAGLRDASNLAWKIAGVLDGRLPHSVLDSYQPERAPHARAVITLAKQVGLVMTRGGRAGDLARRILLPGIRFLPGLRARVTDSVTPALRGSGWVNDARADRLAGTLCPNAITDDGRRFDAVADGGFALVSIHPPAPADEDALPSRGCAVVVVDADSELGGWLRGGKAVAALVRPDGTVALSARRVGDVVGTVRTLINPAATGVRSAAEVVSGR